VVLDRAGGQIISISTFAGPLAQAGEGIADLGGVSAREAASYLLTLAERGEGRVSRDAIMPAAIADSADIAPRLLAIARNRAIARETRSAALAWLGRPLEAATRSTADVSAALLAIARDEEDSRTIRQHALRGLARLDHGSGTTPLIDIARDQQHAWLSREAIAALRVSADPRARQHLRDVVRESSLPDEAVAVAVRGVGDAFANAADVKLLRDSFARLPGTRSREAAMSAVASFGGSENVRWLLAVAGDPDQRTQERRRAVHHAYRAGASVADLVAVYDGTTDPQLKDAVIATLAESGETRANDKLMHIARNDDSRVMRRKAIAALGRSSDERVKKFLSELAER
jgi:hypothetical protein